MTVVFAADAVVEAVETVEEVVLPVVDPGPGIKEWLLVVFFLIATNFLLRKSLI